MGGTYYMFCSNCGSQINDEAKFCMQCGTKVLQQVKIESTNSTQFVPAKCTSCGANLEVNPNQEAAICTHCGTPFVISKAISNYQINAQSLTIQNATIINGESAQNYICRAEQAENDEDYPQALAFIEKALNIDANNEIAKKKINEIKNKIENSIFYCFPYDDTSICYIYGNRITIECWGPFHLRAHIPHIV